MATLMVSITHASNICKTNSLQVPDGVLLSSSSAKILSESWDNNAQTHRELAKGL